MSAPIWTWLFVARCARLKTNLLEQALKNSLQLQGVYVQRIAGHPVVGLQKTIAQFETARAPNSQIPNKNGRSVDYAPHCTVGGIIEDLPNYFFLVACFRTCVKCASMCPCRADRLNQVFSYYPRRNLSSILDTPHSMLRFGYDTKKHYALVSTLNVGFQRVANKQLQFSFGAG